MIGPVSEPKPGALAYDGLDAGALAALSSVRAFAEREIIPDARALDAADEYPEAIVEGLRELGVFGFTIPRTYGGRGHSLHAYCLAVEEIARGWMRVAGILNTHFIVLLDAAALRHRRAAGAPPPPPRDRRAARRPSR